MSVKVKNLIIFGCCNSMCNETTKRRRGFTCQSPLLASAMIQGKPSGRKDIFTCKYLEHGDRCPFTL